MQPRGFFELSYKKELGAEYHSGQIKYFDKICMKTGLNEAENGSEFKTGQFAEKNTKMRGVGYLADRQWLSSFSYFSGASTF